jgi:flagellin-like protein
VFKGSKHGMSPLIATVLLIAFAVALGAMIMNWSSSLVGGPDCSGITMIINPYVCYANNLLKVSVQNTGVAADSVNVRVVDADSNEVSFKYNTKIASGEIFKKEFPYERTAAASVEFIPTIKSGDKVVNCEKPVLTVDELQDCVQ